MTSWKLPLFKIQNDDNDVQAVTDVIRSGQEWAVGKCVADFEKGLTEYTSAKYAAVVNSGTSALHLVLLAHGIGQGDEVIVPSFTFIATANSVLFVGARPVFADIEEQTFGLDPADVSKKITLNTKAIIAVHYAGCPCKIEELRSIARANRLLLIEDAAEALGAGINGQNVGTFGDSAVLSFCQNKIITTGEGGAVLTDSKDVYEKILLLRSHGRTRNMEYFTSIDSQDYVTLGYNFRLANINAALGCAQLAKINRLIEFRRGNAAMIQSKLKNVAQISLPEVSGDRFHVYQMFPVVVNEGRNARDGLKSYLGDRGIMTRVYFDPVHLSTFYRNSFGYHGGELPVTESVSDRIISLPFYPDMSEAEIDELTSAIKGFFSERVVSSTGRPSAPRVLNEAF